MNDLHEMFANLLLSHSGLTQVNFSTKVNWRWLIKLDSGMKSSDTDMGTINKEDYHRNLGVDVSNRLMLTRRGCCCEKSS